MRFWDASALVPLFVDEPSTPIVRSLLSTDSKIVISALTRVELSSAIWRRKAPRTLDRQPVAVEAARQAEEWNEVPIDSMLISAIVLCQRHRLRSGDALQLASALEASEDDPTELPFVTLDNELASAARAEGFPVLP